MGGTVANLETQCSRIIERNNLPGSNSRSSHVNAILDIDVNIDEAAYPSAPSIISVAAYIAEAAAAVADRIGDGGAPLPCATRAGEPGVDAEVSRGADNVNVSLGTTAAS